MIDVDFHFKTAEVLCDGTDCKASYDYDSGSDWIDFKDVVKEIREYGWSVSKKDGDWAHYCPDCTEGGSNA